MATTLLILFISFIACSKLNRYLWHSKVAYLLGFKGPACNWRPAYYDIKAEEFNLPADYNYDRFIKEASFLNNEWTCQ